MIECNLCIVKSTFEFHSSVEALFESASWAFFTCSNGNGASGTSEANVVLLILYCSFEEAFAALA